MITPQEAESYGRAFVFALGGIGLGILMMYRFMSKLNSEKATGNVNRAAADTTDAMRHMVDVLREDVERWAKMYDEAAVERSHLGDQVVSLQKEVEKLRMRVEQFTNLEIQNVELNTLLRRMEAHNAQLQAENSRYVDANSKLQIDLIGTQDRCNVLAHELAESMRESSYLRGRTNELEDFVRNFCGKCRDETMDAHRARLFPADTGVPGTEEEMA